MLFKVIDKEEVLEVDSFHLLSTIDYVDLEDEKPLSKSFLKDFLI